MARGLSSREVLLAWRLDVDEASCARGRGLGVFETYVEDDEGRPRLRSFTPAELRAAMPEAFTLDDYADGEWTFACMMHDDAWANGDGEALAGRLAKLSPSSEGIVVAAQDGTAESVWLVENGAAHAVRASEKRLAFAPAPAAGAMRRALTELEAAASSTPRPKRVAPEQALPALVARYLPGLAPTTDPLRYDVAGQPGFEVCFVEKARSLVPVLRHGDAERALEPIEAGALEEGVRELGSSTFQALGVELPLFLAEQGAVVDRATLLAAFHAARRQMERVARAARARPDVIASCVDFLLGGVWDEVARKGLVACVEHPSCPRAIVEELATHTSKSIREACAARLANG